MHLPIEPFLEPTYKHKCSGEEEQGRADKEDDAKRKQEEKKTLGQ